MELKATQDLTAEILDTATSPKIRELWWSCQLWIECNRLGHDTHSDLRTFGVVTTNQERIEKEMYSRFDPVPMKPPSAYATLLIENGIRHMLDA